MRQWRWWGVAGILLGVAAFAWAQAYHNESRIVDFQNGLRASLIAPSSSTGSGLDESMVLGSTDATSITRLASTASSVLTAVGERLVMPEIQTIATTDTIVANACGGVKRITAASAIGTNTTNTFTAHVAGVGGVTGCRMLVCNVGATNTITIDKNAATLLVGGADVALLANSCIGVAHDGTLWRQVSAQLTAT